MMRIGGIKAIRLFKGLHTKAPDLLLSLWLCLTLFERGVSFLGHMGMTLRPKPSWAGSQRRLTSESGDGRWIPV